jgi:hypothetical protein
MNESSLTKVDRRRLLTQVNPCIPTNVTPKTATPDQNGPSPNGRLRLGACCREKYPPVVLPMSLDPIPAFCRQAAPATTSKPEPEPKRVPGFRTSPSLAGYPRRTLIASIE